MERTPYTVRGNSKYKGPEAGGSLKSTTEWLEQSSKWENNHRRRARGNPWLKRALWVVEKALTLSEMRALGVGAEDDMN